MAPADGRVMLQAFDTAERAIDIVSARHANVAATDPVLSNNLTAASADDMRDWHARQQMWAITRESNIVGVLAVAPGSLGWISGQEINEEVIAVTHGGHRYASSTQCAWAQGGFAESTDLLIGPIDRHNHPSRTTAVRAGRPRVLDDVFITLDGSDPAGGIDDSKT